MKEATCKETIGLSREGETSRFVKCWRRLNHLGKCEAEATLTTFEGPVIAEIRWMCVRKAKALFSGK